MNYAFSKRSYNNLMSCHPDLQKLAKKVMDLQLFDFGISAGYRDKDEQDKLFHSGMSKVQFPDSKHNISPSMAFDFTLWVNGRIDWNNTEAWYMAVGVFRGVAASLGLKIRCGADWDGDFNPNNQSFHDLPHIELIIN